MKVTVTGSDGSASRCSRPTRCCRRSASRRGSQGYGLEHTGVALTERGAIDVDGLCRTNVDGIYAIGDVTAKLMLAHAAEAMGVVAAETIAGAETMEIDYVMVPRATYCQPQIASFGYTEEQAKERGHDVKVAKFPFIGERQGARARRRRRLREDRGRRGVRTSFSARTSSARTSPSCCRS